jgi:hypothetical protein
MNNAFFTRNLLALPALVLTVLTGLTACGGGGGGTASLPAASSVGSAAPSSGSSSPSTPVVPVVPAVPAVPELSAAGFPVSGQYATLFKPEGLATAANLGYSLVHPSQRAVEYEIEPTSSRVSGAIEIQSGSVDALGARATGLVANALLYIVNGDVKRLPLTANGRNPKEGILAAGVGTLCDFSSEGTLRPQGVDYAAPLNSKIFATTRGGDGVCKTLDDGQAQITFDSVGKPLVTFLNPLQIGRALAILRDPLTLKPSSTVYERAVMLATPTASQVSFGASSTTYLTRVVDVAVNTALAERSNQLVAVDGTGKVTVVLGTDAQTGTLGGSWNSIGFDRDYFYGYQNFNTLTNNALQANWSLQRISRVSFVASSVAKGVGSILFASLGNNFAYLTLTSGSNYSLTKVAKNGQGSPFPLRGSSATQISIVVPSTDGVHLLQQSNFINLGAAGLVLANTNFEFIDEVSNGVAYSVVNGALFGLTRPNFLALDQSGDVSGFSVLGGISSDGGMLGSSVISYNPQSRTPLNLGTLPGAGEFGAVRAVALSAGFPRGNFFTGNLTSANTTTYFASPRRVFTVDLGVANSLQFTTSVVR